MPDQHLRLSELTLEITRAIGERFAGHRYWVIAEVTSHNYQPGNRYHFFELVEKEAGTSKLLAKIRGTAWDTCSRAIAQFENITGQKFTSNIQVLVSVEVKYDPNYGLAVNLLDIDANFTLGALEQQRRKTLARLVAENPGKIWMSGEKYLTHNNQLSLPVVIQRIAVIASSTSAGAEDLEHTLEQNEFGYRFTIDRYHARVQGDQYAGEVIRQLVEIFNSRRQYDVIVITRGGGAQADFVIFDNYEMARTIARFPVPVITGIGHQRNETIADLMAHRPVKTPTKAAEFIIAHNRATEERIKSYQQSIIIHAQQQLTFASKRLMQTTNALLSTPKIIINNQTNNLENITSNIISFNAQCLKNQRRNIDHLDSLIKLMSPVNILKKGFAIIKSGNRILTDPTQVKTSDEINILMSTASLTATINHKIVKDATDNDL